MILPGHWVGLKKLRAVKRSWEVGSSLALPFHPCGCASHHLPLGFSSPGSPTWQACRPCIHAFTWLVAHPFLPTKPLHFDLQEAIMARIGQLEL